MKMLKEVVEVEKEGLMALLGKDVVIYCVRFAYAGRLKGVNDKCVKLENAHIVYNTGSHTAKKFEDCQKWASDSLYISTAAIEMFSETTQL